MELPLKGQCQCGLVRFECAAPPLFSVTCSCRDCQRTSGAPYVATLRVPADALMIEGEIRRSSRKGDTGGKVENGFCAECGSRVFSVADSLPDTVGLFAASLVDSSWYRPQFAIYNSRMPPWHTPDPTVPAFDTVPSAAQAAEVLGR